MKKVVPAFAFLFISICMQAQRPRIEMLNIGTKIGLRGLSVISDSVIWVSGTQGTVGKSTDGGRSWKWTVVKGFEKTDFRDIEAFDVHTAIIMGIEEPAYLLKTTDGGDSWKVVYKNATKGMFLDAMDFADDRKGMVIGDPINGKVFIATTSDGGDSWQEMPAAQQPAVENGEVFFAASGTNLRFFGDNDYYLVSGGSRSRLFTPSAITDLSIIHGKETTGANSVAVYRRPGKSKNEILVAGGDFNADTSSLQNFTYSPDGGRSWKDAGTPPHGYRSCIAFLSEKKLITCGLTGVDYSGDGGKNWYHITREGFNACAKARNGSAVFLTGGNGKIARFILE